MNELGLKSKVRPKRYRSYKGHVGRIAPNLVNREFVANRPNQKWVTDVTEFKVGDKKVYLSPIIDLFNREVVSYEVRQSVKLSLVTDMLKSAIDKLKSHEKPIVHSDQGWQYQNRQYQNQLREKGLIQSMSRKGNCLDNAVAESFFGILKTEMFHNNVFRNADDLKRIRGEQKKFAHCVKQGDVLGMIHKAPESRLNKSNHGVSQPHQLEVILYNIDKYWFALSFKLQFSLINRCIIQHGLFR